MKSLACLLLMTFPLLSEAQRSDYTISSFLKDGPKAPNTHYIGEAWLSTLVQADSNLNYNISRARFRANSTLDWHKHATPQVLIVLEGEGYYQERGKEPMLMKVGDVIVCPKDTEHWHTSGKSSDVTYLAIYGGTQPTTWTEKLTQAYYDSVAKKLEGGR